MHRKVRKSIFQNQKKILKYTIIMNGGSIIFSAIVYNLQPRQIIFISLKEKYLFSQHNIFRYRYQYVTIFFSHAHTSPNKI